MRVLRIAVVFTLLGCQSWARNKLTDRVEEAHAAVQGELGALELAPHATNGPTAPPRPILTVGNDGIALDNATVITAWLMESDATERDRALDTWVDAGVSPLFNRRFTLTKWDAGDDLEAHEMAAIHRPLMDALGELRDHQRALAESTVTFRTPAALTLYVDTKAPMELVFTLLRSISVSAHFQAALGYAGGAEVLLGGSNACLPSTTGEPSTGDLSCLRTTLTAKENRVTLSYQGAQAGDRLTSCLNEHPDIPASTDHTRNDLDAIEMTLHSGWSKTPGCGEGLLRVAQTETWATVAPLVQMIGAIRTGGADVAKQRVAKQPGTAARDALESLKVTAAGNYPFESLFLLPLE